MITREQVADLREGDVVRLDCHEHPGTAITGPLHLVGRDGQLQVGTYIVCFPDGTPYDSVNRTLTVISRAPRLYVNHDRAEPVAGDVVRDADSDEPRTWTKNVNGFSHEWHANRAAHYVPRESLPARLRLLVDGETGLPPVESPPADPLAHVRKGDDTPEAADATVTCGVPDSVFVCTREPGHPGQHIAGCGAGNPVAAVWS